MTSRLTRHLVWNRQRELETLSLDVAACPREAAVYLLHIGAEVEHALMGQYLYAGYSLGGNHLSAEQQRLVQTWKRTVLQIAREEMGHLATVENMLTLIGGPPTFDREDYPVPDSLYPFPFELEPLTKRSLGKYVLAEMPSRKVLDQLKLTAEIEAIEDYVGGPMDRHKVHRVGIIYDRVIKLFTLPDSPENPSTIPPPVVASTDFSASSIGFQVRPREWGLGYQDMLIGSGSNRDDAVSAIQAIANQGEGSTIADLPNSHFGKFLEIYRQFPEKEWQPARNVARNPSTDETRGASYIRNPVARTWAKLFNLRYRMLLMFLAHSFHIEAPHGGKAHSPRGLLISWAFGEMYNLRSLCEILMTLPMHEPAGTHTIFAGPPFEMPYSLALAAHEHNRWRGHRDLVEASQSYIRELKKDAGLQEQTYLQGLESANRRALEQIIAIIGA